MTDETGQRGADPPEPEDTWSVADAKARFSELLQQVDETGPQVITRRGRQVAVVVSMAQWQHKTRRAGSLAEFLAQSPLPSSGLELPPREKEDMREVFQ